MTIKQLIYKDCMYVSVHAHFLEALDLVKTVHNILVHGRILQILLRELPLEVKTYSR